VDEQKLKVLLVEDNPGDVILLVEALEKSGNGGFELSHAGDLELAMKRIHAEKFDAVLLDLSIPLFLGLEPLERIRRIRPKLPVIVLSGFNDPELAAESIRKGALNYMVKNKLDGAVLAQMLISVAGNGGKPGLKEGPQKQ